MKCSDPRLGLARRLLAVSVSFAVALSSSVFAFASPGKRLSKSVVQDSAQTDSAKLELQVNSASATATATGVVIQWHTNAAADNLGFNIYRVKDGQRARANREIIPGAVFAGNGQAFMRAGYSYAWFDRGGTSDSSYYIESVSLQGVPKIHEAISPSKTVSRFEQTPETLGSANPSGTQSTDAFEKSYPAAEAQINSPNGTLADQWAIAAQTGLKIGIKKDGWYRVTQPQMVAAGFNPAVDIRNLRLFVDATEVAINTSQSSGQFGSGDYIEFYGRGLDLPTTDTRIYYLIAGTTPGKRVGGEIHLDGDPVLPPAPVATPPGVSQSPAVPAVPLLRDPIFYSLQSNISWILSSDPGNPPAKPRNGEPEVTSATNPVLLNPERDELLPDYPQSGAIEQQPKSARVSGRYKSVALANEALAVVGRTPAVGSKLTLVTTKAGNQSGKTSNSKKRKGNKRRRPVRIEHSHAEVNSGFTPPSFDNTSERKDRTVYFSSLLNGDAENFFGKVVGFSPATQTLASPNADLTAAGPAKLEVAMQGVTFVNHQVSLKFNGVSLGLVLAPPPQSSFFGQDHVVATFDVPVSLLQSVNTLTFTGPCLPSSPCPDTTIVDYIHLTYRHQFRYDNAIGNIHLASQPVEGDTLVVGSKTYTFKSSPASNLEIGIGPDTQATAGNIANRINLDSATTLCTAVSGPADVGLTANTGGIAGSSITLSVPINQARLITTIVADPGAVRFSLRGTQSVTLDGFTMPSVRLIDYTDPLAVTTSKPASQSSASGFAITVPKSFPASKTPRLLLAIPEGQFNQPASLVLNQPSSLNLNSNAADFLIVSHKDFIASFEPLRIARNQGNGARVVDVEDIYDEFSYGVHGPQAIKDFLQYAATHWGNGTLPPRYIVFGGDASMDPHNYEGAGNFDMVPTKLIDTSYEETADDDWLADFDGDGIADIPVGRIPVRTTAEADLIVSKIVNYVPANVPQAAVLIADDPVGGFDFEEANDNVQALLPAGMTVQRVNVRTEGAAQSTIDIRDGINQGRAIVNYSGHGNIDVWSGQGIWHLNDASGLANGVNKLTFVIVMDCLNGYFQDPNVQSLSEAFLKAPGGGAVAAFASSGKTVTLGQRQMELALYAQLYGSQPIAVGDAIKIAKAASSDIDVKRTWIFFGDPSIKIR